MSCDLFTKNTLNTCFEINSNINLEIREVKMTELTVLDQKISYFKIEDEDYISITDMLKSKDGNFFVSDWLRNRNTIEFLGIWEEIHNPNFNYGEFAIIKGQAGLNSYKISVKEWVEKTNAIGIMSKAGRYGGTYAHKDLVCGLVQSLNYCLLKSLKD